MHKPINIGICVPFCVRHVQRCLLGRRFISEWESAAKIFEPTETCWLSTVRLALAHAIIDGGAYLAVIMGIIGGWYQDIILRKL